MYSNSIDFGGYDYSGNPNLMRVIKASEFRKQGDSDVLISDVEYNSIRLTSQKVNHLWVYSENNVPSLVSGKTYTMSAKVKIEEGTTGNIDQITVSYRNANGGKILLAATGEGIVVGKEIIIKGTSSVNYEIADLSRFYLDIEVGGDINGSVIVSDVKIEEGPTATPYQPNLLDAPYYLSKVALGENLIKPESQQPVTNSNYLIKTYNTKPMVKGKKYTITLEGTKPATQVFRPFFTQATGSPWGFGDLKPVEGLTDIWSATFTASTDSHPTSPQVQIYQVPNTSVGQCTIKWLKLEEGDTRTPNISQFKYFGEGLKDSNNPNDYSWDVTPEYTEKGLNDAVNVYDPQRVEGLKNFADGIQIAGDRVVGENEHTIYKLDKSNSNSFIDGYATFIKHGKIVIVNGTVKFKKAYAFGVPLDDEVPEEFIARGVNGMIIGASGTSNSAKMIYVRQDFKSIMTNSEFAINEWFTFNGSYWVGEE